MNYEQSPPTKEPVVNVDRPIAELLPRYYEAYGQNPTYDVERSIMIDGHEVAWLHYQGEVTFDITGKGQEGKAYEGHELHCACRFTEGVGWQIDVERGTPVGFIGRDECDKKRVAMHMRHLELRQEYQERGMLGDTGRQDAGVVKAIMLDLIQKREADEFVEGTTGAEFWGGHYYLQTVGEITGLSMKQVWEGADLLLAEKRIRLEGMVVQTYRPPVEPMTYEPGQAPEATLHYEKTDKVWALVPRPEESDLDLNEAAIDDTNRQFILGRCVLGLAHTAELAQARLAEAIANPRLSHERLYQQSFVESGYPAGALAVVAYTARTSTQPEEWIVEGFLGDAVVPEVRKLPMDYPTIFGIDAADQAQLNAKIEEWWPG